MAIVKVWLDESESECISCGNCADAAPEVFEVPDKMVVKPGVDFQNTKMRLRKQQIFAQQK